MLPFLFAVLNAPDPVEIDYVSRSGLFVKVHGIPVVEGSFFQVYEPGWSKGYFSSNWNDQTVTKTAKGVRMTSMSTDKLTEATFDFVRTGEGIEATYSVIWRGPKTAHLELSLGHLWAPAFENGSVKLGSVERTGLTKRLPPSNTSEERQLGPHSSDFEFRSPLGQMEVLVDGGNPVSLFDARGYQSDWSTNKDLFWFGMENVELKPGVPTVVRTHWKLDLNTPAASTVAAPIAAKWNKAERAFGPYEPALPMIPEPKDVKLVKSPRSFVWGHTLDIQASTALRPAITQAHRLVSQRYTGMAERGGKVVASIKNLGLAPGGYELNSSTGQLIITGQDAEGVRNGFRRAATLTRPENGKLIVPPMVIRDYPSIGWRGLHLFVGPEALNFQGAMMDRMLSPLMYNQIVLQAERTNWDAIRGTESGWTMKKTDLAKLVRRYREVGMEPTPLIQSFGHMGWLFMNGKNKDLMFNPSVPFSIDPRVPRSQTLLRELWKEVMATFGSDIMHFGLDEVDMRGWPAGDHQLVTDLWKMQTAFLAKLAKEHEATMMVWGDKMLAPGEAPDAAHGHTKAHAKARRDALPRGAYVADWHYKNDANPKIYTSLELFKKEGLKPVAATWWRPDNIKGFFAAAANSRVGTLHTTWAGYESNEANMVREFDQMVSYILVGEYAWSNRAELPKDLPYQPDDVLRQLYGASATPVHSGPAWQAGNGSSTPITVGNHRFQKWDSPLRMANPLNAESPNVSAHTVNVGQRGSAVAALVSCQTRLTPNDAVGQLTIELTNGTKIQRRLNYGRDLRAIHEKTASLKSPQKEGLYAIELRVGSGQMIRRVTLTSLNPVAGLSLHGLNVIP